MMKRYNSYVLVKFILNVILNFNVFCGGLISERKFTKKYSGIYFLEGYTDILITRSLADCSKTCGILENCLAFSKRKLSHYCILYNNCPDTNVYKYSADSSSITYCRDDLDNSVTTSPPSPTTSPLSITTSQLFVTTTQSLAPTSTAPPPKDCKELYDRGQSSTGVYEIDISDSIIKSVICDMTTQDGGWTVIQNRNDGTVDFYRTWSQYKNGFGSAETEYWIGNEAIYQLVSLYTNTKLYIEMEDWSSNIKYALYNQFNLYSEVQDYRIYVSGYSGTSGDCIDYYDASFGGSKDKFSHNNMKFSTWDEDNDIHPSVNCGETMKGGWWYSECMASNLNGLYLASGTVDSTSMSCKTFGNDYQSLKRVKMMIKGVS